jgi:hypothetical protein
MSPLKCLTQCKDSWEFMKMLALKCLTQCKDLPVSLRKIKRMVRTCFVFYLLFCIIVSYIRFLHISRAMKRNVFQDLLLIIFLFQLK